MNHYKKSVKKSVKKWIAIAISMAMVLTSVLTGNVTTGSAASAPKLNFSKKTVTAGRKVTESKKEYNKAGRSDCSNTGTGQCCDNNSK